MAGESKSGLSKSPKPAVAAPKSEAPKVETQPVTVGAGEVHIHKDHRTAHLVFDLGEGQRAVVAGVVTMSAEELERDYAPAEVPVAPEPEPVAEAPAVPSV